MSSDLLSIQAYMQQENKMRCVQNPAVYLVQIEKDPRKAIFLKKITLSSHKNYGKPRRCSCRTVYVLPALSWTQRKSLSYTRK